MDRFDLRAHTRKIQTKSAEAQRWFDLGLNWCFGFNQDRGETEELPTFEAKLAIALSKVDVPITSSCMCRTKVYQPKDCCAS